MKREELQKIVDSKAALTDLNGPHHYKQALVYDQWALRVDMARVLLAIHEALDKYDKHQTGTADHEEHFTLSEIQEILGRRDT